MFVISSTITFCNKVEQKILKAKAKSILESVLIYALKYKQKYENMKAIGNNDRNGMQKELEIDL